ncbi:MAG: hypothetical protein ABJA66_05580, partial [Actinomycetota bacterium]
THYHELAELTEILPRLENLHFLIEENADELTFKYKLEKGTALKSYGVYAAKLAGLPKPVIRRAVQLLAEYENSDGAPTQRRTGGGNFSNQIERKLGEIDLDSLSPVEALMKLYELKNLVKSTSINDNKTELKRVVG